MKKKPRPAAPKTCHVHVDMKLGDDVALVAENMDAILGSPSYSLAQEDPSLLEKVEMRGVRMLLELNKPELALQANAITSTVIVFGGQSEARYPRLDEQVCGTKRSELRDTFEAALWQKNGYPEHVIHFNNHNVSNIKAELKCY